MKFINKNNFKNALVLTIILLIGMQLNTNAQYKNRWMNAGALHNWFCEIGSELEEGGFVKTQQEGFSWPSIYPYQDMQAARGFWIGARDFTDEKGDFYPYKVVTAGPRNPAIWAFYPQEFKMIGKFPLSEVTVDGNITYQKDVTIDEIDNSIVFDRQLRNVVNTQLGVTMTRTISQFSQPYNDNYILVEYEFKNTGNTDADPDIELPNQTLKDVVFYFTHRMAVNKQSRYVIGNSTGWGKNTMIDSRGDGIHVDPANEQFRAQFGWHGYTNEKEVGYDNIGAPIWAINSNSKNYLDPGDTVGRLGATQFFGFLTLHADKSTTDQNDDLTQPTTTFYENSDDLLFLAGASPYNQDRMAREYTLITKGHPTKRHAETVEPSGDYANQKTDPNLGNSGGFSIGAGYGPYTLGPGESVKIVVAEVAAGMSYAEQLRIGKLFKQGKMTAYDKNKEVMKGKDSLFKSFRNIITAYNAGWDQVPQPPRPPKMFSVQSGGDRITLSWDVDTQDPNPAEGFEIWRALGNVDSTYYLVHTASADERTYEDKDLIRGFNYYYYVVSYRTLNVGAAGTPAGKLRSGRYYTQTYDPANLQRMAGTQLSQIRIVPNPYHINAQNSVRFPGVADADKIAFYNIPGECTIDIYTELGELIKTIEHSNGSGDEFWYCVTSSNQIVVSGIYIAVVTDKKTGEKHIAKFAVIR